MAMSPEKPSLEKLLQEDSDRLDHNKKKNHFDAQLYQENQSHNEEKWALLNGHFSESIKIGRLSCNDQETLVEDKSPLQHPNHDERLVAELLRVADIIDHSNGGLLSNLAQKRRHIADPNHELILCANANGRFFKCNACGNPGSGISYNCPICVSDYHTECVITPLWTILHNHSNPATPSQCEDAGTKMTATTVLAGNTTSGGDSPAGSPQIAGPSAYYVRQASVGQANVEENYANCIVATGMVLVGCQQGSQAGSPASQSHYLDIGSPKDGTTKVVLITGEAMNGRMMRSGNGSCSANPCVDQEEMPRSRCCCLLKCLWFCHIGQPR